MSLHKTPSDTTFTFLISSELNLQVQVRVDRLAGLIPAYRVSQLDDSILRPSALFVEACLCSHGEVLGIPFRTECVEAGLDGCSWNTWLTFPIKYRDLQHVSQLALTVWEVREAAGCRPLGGSTFTLFSKKGRLKTGIQLLQLWPGQEADVQWPTTTPGKVPVKERGELGRVDQVLKRYERGEIEHVDWLDRLTMRAIDTLRRQQHAEQLLVPAAAAIAALQLNANGNGYASTGSSPAQQQQPAVAPSELQLSVELLTFPQAVVFQQAVVGHAPASALAASTTDALETPLPGTSGTGVVPPGAAGSPSAAAGSASASGAGGVIQLHDPEVGRENPAELKAQKLARSVTRGMVDRALKPDTEERARIEAVLDYPPNRPLGGEDRMLLWRFRFALTSDKRALTKFLKCVDWSDASEARQAAELMQQWAPIDVADALELLSPDFVNDEVRGHAVEVLQKTDDEELLYYLLQLVQALRYESCDSSQLARFLVERAQRSVTVACFLFWYLCTELDDPTFGPRASYVQGAFLQQNSVGAIEESISQQLNLAARLRHIVDIVKAWRGSAAKKTEALRLLFAPSGQCSDMCHMSCPCPLDPSIQLVGVVPEQCSVFKSALTPLRLAFRALLPATATPGVVAGAPGGTPGVAAAGPGGLEEVASPAGEVLSPRQSTAGQEGWEVAERPHSQQQQRGQQAAGDPEAQHLLSRRTSTSSRTPGPTPPQRTSSSAEGPWLSTPFEAAARRSSGVLQRAGTEALMRQASVSPLPPQPTAVVTLIYKKGDDLRQDQLVVQMFSLMDRLLKREHLDLRITPYHVLPTSSSDGLIQFVPSMPLARLLAEHRSIHRFLAMHHPDPKGPFGLRGEVLSTFVKSCAGYCVMTYILGVGDRHLDNLMVTTDGRLFHIDFGYILGRDPKPFPPPMKLCKEMVDAMGGQDSDHYRQFQTYCVEAYNILRKSANLLLSLFHLMAGASIPDIQSDPEKAMLKLQEKLRLDLRDEEAGAWMQQLLGESATALMPQIMEATHKYATEIEQTLQKYRHRHQQEAEWGCFESIDIEGPPLTAWLLKASVSLRTRLLCRPYGDQGLFVRRGTFQRMGGYKEWPLLEDLDLVQRLSSTCGPPAIVPCPIRTSGRRWAKLGFARTTLVNQAVLLGHRLGVDVGILAKWYEQGMR
ncbi:hypothetical protein N2152v2_009113 [Parachlorella kessleri]